MRLPRAAAVIAALLTLVPSVSAEWTQDGGDAGRSGYLGEGGPGWEEVALVLDPPADQSWRLNFAPLSVGNEVLAATNRSLVAIDLETGGMREVGENFASNTSISPPSQWAIIGRTLYVAEPRKAAGSGSVLTPAQLANVTPGRLRVVDIDSGAETVRPLSDAGTVSECSIGVGPGSTDAYTACIIDGGAAFGGLTPNALQVRRIRQDGFIAWSWTKEADAQAQEAPLFQPGARAPVLRLVGLSVVGGLVIPVTKTVAATAAAGKYWDGWVLDRESGKLALPPGIGPTGQFGNENHFGWGPDGSSVPAAPTFDEPAAVAGDEVSWVRKERSVSITIDPPLDLVIAASRSPDFAFESRVRLRGMDTGARPALHADTVFVATDSVVAAIARDGEQLWEHELGGLRALALPLLADSARVFVFTSVVQGGTTRMLALNATGGETEWEHRFDGTVTVVGAAGGTITSIVRRADFTTKLVVLGRTNASIRIQQDHSDEFPRPGGRVWVDLSGTQSGVGGPPTRYRSDWGDGRVTDWQTSPVLEHAYDTVGDHTAHVFAANDAGQVSSQAVTFHVGRSPPQNFLQEQFANENQERTFFLLGLIVTGLAALFGFARLRRRRNILARELADLDHAVKAAPHDPAALDRVLDERRLRARALLLGGKLDENQHAVLAARVEELSRAVRLDMVQERLDFLPFRHVRALREMLQDGRITSLERAHYLAMLDGDATLTSEYKARVRAVVDEWAAHDSGAGA